MSEITRDHHDPNDDRDFRQFARAFDRPIAPAPAFAESLRREIVRSELTSTANHPPTTSTVIARESPVVNLADRRRHHIGLSILEIAAALLLISALALSAYVINAVGRPIGPDEGSGPGRLSHGIASPAGDESTDGMPAGINWGGNPGKTWYFGDARIDTGVPPLFIEIRGPGLKSVGPGLIAADSWYGWTADVRSNAFLRWDLIADFPVWIMDYRTWGTPASDGERIFTFLLDESETPTPVPVAIDMDTGEIVWRGPTMHPFATSFEFDSEATPTNGSETVYVDMMSEEQGPVVLGDSVVFSDGAGTTVALNAQDGSERWRYHRSAHFFGYSGNIEPPSGGTIVANDKYLFVILPDRSISRLDPMTGRQIDHLARVDPYFRDRHMTALVLHGDSLIAMTASSSVGSGSKFAALLVMDAETFELTASTDITKFSFTRSVVVTDTSAYIRAGDEPGGMKLYEVDLATGQMSGGFGGDLPGGEVRLSGAGDTLIAATSTGTVFYFSFESHERIQGYREYAPGPVTLVGGPVQVADGRAVVIWKTGPNSPVPQAMEATPIP